MVKTATAPNQQPISDRAAMGFAIASLVLGICAVLSGWVFVGLLPGVLAVIFGIIALKKRIGKGLAIAGIVTGGIGLLSAVVVIALAFQYAPSLQQPKASDSPDARRKTDVTTITSYISSYQSQNNGKLPRADVIGRTYATENVGITSIGEPTNTVAVYTVGENCNSASGEQQFALRIKLNDGSIYCKGS